MLSKLSSFILGCIFLIVTPIVASAANSDSSALTGPQAARVVVPRAIVYSDEAMNSPLGYISNDKIITVGSPRKRNPELVPLVLYGRLAFIEIKNIHYENESDELLNSKRGAPREHNIDILLTKTEEKLSENNSAYFSLHQFSAGEEIKNLIDDLDQSGKENFVGYGVSLIHRQLTGRSFWGAGFEFNRISSSNLKFDLYMINPMVGYTPIKNELFLMDLTFSLDFSGSAELSIINNYSDEPTAFVWGPQFGARLVFFPYQKYHIVGAVGYRNYKVLRLENLVDANDETIGSITKINGLNLSIGLAFEI